MVQYNNNLVYPKICTVLKLPAERFVYPIFKNASTSLEELSISKIYNKQIYSISTIDVYWRESQNRFNSGVNQYLKNNKLLDSATIIELIKRSELVNRHFMPQYMWLHHLYKYYTGTIKILDINSLNIPIHRNESKYKGNFIAPAHWIELDNLIYGKFVGETIDIKEINKYIQDKHKVLYKKCIAQE